MKKNPRISFIRLFILIALTSFSCTSRAAKAFPLPMTFSQPDGSKISVILKGDEFLHWYSTRDGVLLSRAGDIFYVASVDANGDISSTGILAHESGSRTGDEQIAIINQKTSTFFNAAPEKMSRAARKSLPLDSATPSFFPHTGAPKAVVILANFNDVKFTLDNPWGQFNQIFNATEAGPMFGTSTYQNYTSIRQYFNTISSGDYTPEFKIVGPVTLPNNMKYYGGTDDNGRDEKADEMVTSAITLASDSINFADPSYDSNNDGTMDMVFVIYAGYGQNSQGPNESVWAKSGEINKTINNVKFGRFCVSCELFANADFWKEKNNGIPCINGTGVVCHEFSHAMGLPDIYPTVSAAYLNNQEMEYWDLMDGGEYVKNGYRPTAYTAWEREVMGWFKIDTLKNDTTVTSMAAALTGGKAYRILNDADNSEYFVLENVQRKGLNGAMSGHGLLVYHVKWPSTYVSLYNSINNTPNKPDMAVVPADGALLSAYIDANKDYYISSLHGDPFPGTQYVSVLNNTQNLPNFAWYSGASKVNKALKNITEDTTTGTLSFEYIKDFATGIKSITTPSASIYTGRIYTIDGRYVGNSLNILPKGLYIRDGKKFIIK
jgi:immune inhibitor A